MSPSSPSDEDDKRCLDVGDLDLVDDGLCDLDLGDLDLGDLDFCDLDLAVNDGLGDLDLGDFDLAASSSLSLSSAAELAIGLRGLCGTSTDDPLLKDLLEECGPGDLGDFAPGDVDLADKGDLGDLDLAGNGLDDLDLW